MPTTTIITKASRLWSRNFRYKIRKCAYATPYVSNHVELNRSRAFTIRRRLDRSHANIYIDLQMRV